MMGDIDMGVFSIDGLEWLVPNVGMYWVSLPGLLNSFEEVDEYYNNGWMFQRHKEGRCREWHRPDLPGRIRY